jgi:hypothetical protein
MRPTIFDRPMTSAERVRRHRAIKRENGGVIPKRVTRKERAKIAGTSLRTFYAIQRLDRDAAIRWPPDILNGRYGRVGLQFLADVSGYGSIAEQRKVRDTIRRKGAAAGRALWRQIRKERREREGAERVARINASLRASVRM